LQSFVLIATKGRAKATYTLLDSLERQTRPPRRTIIIGTSDADIEGLDRHPLALAGAVDLLKSDRAGLTIQRNLGLDFLFSGHPIADDPETMVVFYDDDYRPADDWLEQCSAAFDSPDCIAVTGQILADGVIGPSITEEDARRYIAGEIPKQPHWAGSPNEMDTASLYGCNMAFRAAALSRYRFDEALPLYGWLEDRDMTGMVKAMGRAIYSPLPRGVHLGVKAGRVSGVRFGYSQIANPIYMRGKRTIDVATMWTFLLRALAANLIRTVTRDGRADYYGRLRGNAHAIWDLVRGRCAPQRIVDLTA
jgi:hypothetical protein